MGREAADRWDLLRGTRTASGAGEEAGEGVTGAGCCGGALELCLPAGIHSGLAGGGVVGGAQ
jgi:hypothetical protein